MTRELPASTPTTTLALMVLGRTRRGGLFRGVGIEAVVAGAELLDLEIAGDLTLADGRITRLADTADAPVVAELRRRLAQRRNGVALSEWLRQRGPQALTDQTDAAVTAGLLRPRRTLLGPGGMLRPDPDVRAALVATVAADEPLSAAATALATLVQGSGLGLTLGLREAGLDRLRANATATHDPVVRALVDLPVAERQYVRFGEGLLES